MDTILLWMSCAFTVVGSGIGLARLFAAKIRHCVTRLGTVGGLTSVAFAILFFPWCWPLLSLVGPITQLNLSWALSWFWWLLISVTSLLWAILISMPIRTTWAIIKGQTKSVQAGFSAASRQTDINQTTTPTMRDIDFYFGTIMILPGMWIGKVATRLLQARQEPISPRAAMVTYWLALTPTLLWVAWMAVGLPLAVCHAFAGRTAPLALGTGLFIAAVALFLQAKLFITLADWINRTLQSEARSALWGFLFTAFGALLATIAALLKPR